MPCFRNVALKYLRLEPLGKRIFGGFFCVGFIYQQVV